MHTIYEDEVGRLRLEEHPELGLVLHADIYKWSKEAFKHSERVFDDVLLSLANKGVTQLYSAIPISDRKNQKFAAAYGFIRTGQQMIKANDPEAKYDLWLVETGVH